MLSCCAVVVVPVPVMNKVGAGEGLGLGKSRAGDGLIDGPGASTGDGSNFVKFANDEIVVATINTTL